MRKHAAGVATDMAGLTYFVEDGSYGNAQSLVVVDTSEFTEDDWEIIENESYWNRPRAAEHIAERNRINKAK